MSRWNWNWNWNEGFRGHRNVRKGSSVAAVVAGVLGLCFFGWIILAIIGGVLGGVFMILGSVIRGLARLAPRVFSGIFSTKGFALGVAIGLIYYFRHFRKSKVNDAEEEARIENGSTVDGAPVETEIVEAPTYRSFGA